MKSDVKKTFLYWTSQEPTVHSMFRASNAAEFEGREKEEILGYLPALEGKNILDLASGIGRFTRHFSSLSKHLISVDMMPHFVEKNRLDHADCSNVTFLCSDALDLSIEKSSLDFIFMNWLLMYLEDEEVKLLFKKMHEWLKPNGEIFFRESCAPTQRMSSEEGYLAHYRTLGFYDALCRNGFSILREGHIRTYVEVFANPFQCFWVFRRADRY